MRRFSERRGEDRRVRPAIAHPAATRRRSMRRWGAGIVVGAVITASAHTAASPPGFVDGTWEGTMVWDASVKFPDLTGSGKSTGSFTVQFSGGIPTGEALFVADGSGTTPEARAELLLTGSGLFGGTADAPVILPDLLIVVGTVEVYGVGTFPVEATLGKGDLTDLPLDIVSAGCTFAAGLFTTRIGDLGAAVAGAGGSLSVQRAYWSALRVGEGGAASKDQMHTIDQLVKDGVALAQAIDDGSFDSAGLTDLLRRAEEFAAAIQRNAACAITTPGHFTTAITGVVTEILTRMVANEALFDPQQFWTAILAGVQSGALGSSAGAAAQQLTLDLTNVLWGKFTAAVAGSNAADLYAIHFAALSLGAEELANEALTEAAKL